jgi:hypothetical protein
MPSLSEQTSETSALLYAMYVLGAFHFSGKKKSKAISVTCRGGL